MRVAVRPPEFLPRLDYFALMCHVDMFVVADTFQYSRQSYQNRTKLRTPDGWQWQSIPLEGRQHGRAINETRISHGPTEWKRKLWRSLEFNYRSTPFFAHYEDDLKNALNFEALILGAYTSATIRCIHELLQITTPLKQASEFAGKARSVSEVLDRLENPQLVVLEDTAQRDAAALGRVEVHLFHPPAYRQNFSGFEPGMSSVDALFNLGPQATREMLARAIR